MAKGLTLDIGANTREVVKGARDTADALEEISDALDPLVKDGDEAGKRIEKGLDGVPREVDKVERSFKDLARAAERESKAAGDDIGRNVERGTDKAKDGVDEIGREAESTAKEAAASFDGSAESIGDAFQEVAANAFAGFGLAGVVAGTAAAIGLGLVTAELTKQQEETDKLKERLSGLYQAAIEEGRDYISEAQIIQESQDLIWNVDRVDEYNQVQEDAKTLGLDINQVIRARSGDEDANNAVISRGKALLEEVGAQLSDNDETNDAAAGKRFGEINKAIEGNRAIATELDANKERVDATNKLLANSTERQRDTTAATRGTRDAVNEVGAAIANLPNAERVIKFRVDRSEYDGFVAGVKNGTINVPVSIRAAERGGLTP